MFRRRVQVLPFAIAALAASGAWAVAAADLGAPAGRLAVAQWIKGTPVEVAAGSSTNVYVVEFWATWCPPCRMSIPHLTALQDRFRDRGLVIVGISDEPAAT